MLIPRADFDSPWKTILQENFPAFVAFYYPQAFAEIDWDRGYEFLDNELRKVTRTALATNHRIDKLIKVWRKSSGDEVWILIHLEIQSQKEDNFPRRMYASNYRLWDQYQRPIASFAVLADNKNRWRPTQFQMEIWGCKTGIEFPIVKLLDYRTRQKELEQSVNPFAMITLAHLCALETKHNDQARFLHKWTITRQLYQRGWDKEKILQVYIFIEWVLALPENLELQYFQEVEQLEEELDMRYVTNAERFYTRRGEVKILSEQLQQKFNIAPESYAERLQRADESEVIHWSKRLLDAKTLEEVFN